MRRSGCGGDGCGEGTKIGFDVLFHEPFDATFDRVTHQVSDSLELPMSPGMNPDVKSKSTVRSPDLLFVNQESASPALCAMYYLRHIILVPKSVSRSSYASWHRFSLQGLDWT